MAREYEGNPNSKCMNARKGDCGGLRCPCEDYQPTYMMTAEEAELIIPGARDRSINPGGIHYKSRHTRTAGEHRYPREDIVVDTLGNKFFGGYDSELKGLNNISKNQSLVEICLKYPRIRLVCSHCGYDKSYAIENIVNRPTFIFKCIRCDTRNEVDVDRLIDELAKYNEEPEDYFRFDCTHVENDNTPSMKELAKVYQDAYAYYHTENLPVWWQFSEEIRLLIKKIGSSCVFIVNKCECCVFDGKSRYGARCSKEKCKNYKKINFNRIDLESWFNREILPVYQARLQALSSECRSVEAMLREVKLEIGKMDEMSITDIELTNKRKALSSQLQLLQSERKRIKSKLDDMNFIIRKIKKSRK